MHQAASAVVAIATLANRIIAPHLDAVAPTISLESNSEKAVSTPVRLPGGGGTGSEESLPAPRVQAISQASWSKSEGVMAAASRAADLAVSNLDNKLIPHGDAVAGLSHADVLEAIRVASQAAATVALARRASEDSRHAMLPSSAPMTEAGGSSSQGHEYASP